LIYNYPEQLFADQGVMVIEHADFEGIERLAATTGAEIISTFDSPNRVDVLGFAKKIEEIMIGEDRFIKFSGCKRNEVITIIEKRLVQLFLEDLLLTFLKKLKDHFMMLYVF
jgi:T-complex protein 1 subunit beta